jgi:MFS family permease
MVKKFLMTTLWRITQTGPFLSLFFWSTALAGIFWPILGDRPSGPDGPLWDFVTRNLGVAPERAALVGVSLLALATIAMILAFGYVYDRVFKLWREQMDVVVERNPYAEDRLMHKERTQWALYYLPLARALYKVSPDPELKAAIDRVEGWVSTGKMQIPPEVLSGKRA